MAKDPERLTVPSIQFLGEQDGVAEREFKARLCDFFSTNGTVTRAYLARLCYANSNSPEVALCVRTTAVDERPLQIAGSRIFSEMFRNDAHLDILFLSDVQENELQALVTPFFTNTP